MSKLFLHMMTSLDGYIEGPNKELDWHFVDEEYEAYSVEMLRSIDGIVLGRSVYELFATFWPAALDNPASAPNPAKPELHLEAAALLHSLPKYVVSTTLKMAQWNNSSIIAGDLAADILRRKSKSVKGIALFGGARLAASMMKLGLIDEYRLIVNPVLLGGGTPLFDNKITKTILELVGTHIFRSGAVLLKYVPENK
jgi:dihydrofolate reductase